MRASSLLISGRNIWGMDDASTQLSAMIAVNMLSPPNHGNYGDHEMLTPRNHRGKSAATKAALLKSIAKMSATAGRFGEILSDISAIKTLAMGSGAIMHGFSEAWSVSRLLCAR